MKASQLIRDIANAISNSGDRDVVFSVDSATLMPTHSVCEVEHLPSSKNIVISVWNR